LDQFSSVLDLEWPGFTTKCSNDAVSQRLKLNNDGTLIYRKSKRDPIMTLGITKEGKVEPVELRDPAYSPIKFKNLTQMLANPVLYHEFKEQKIFRDMVPIAFDDIDEFYEKSEFVGQFCSRE
jgi:hypothetical protein